MAQAQARSFSYVVVFFQSGNPLFFGPFKKEEQLITEAKAQRKIFPNARLLRLKFNEELFQ